MTYASLDKMIELDKDRMLSDPWYQEGLVYEQSDGHSVSVGDAWKELNHLEGPIKYRGEVFVVTHSRGSRGSGGMDEGSPPSITVYRIKP